ncbi:MAG: spondin domain-containing protein [Pseudomonadota bacterium]
MTELRVTVRNTSQDGGTFLTPTYVGFHDGSFDIFETGEAASAGLEMLAEDGDAGGLTSERLAADADSQGLMVIGAAGPIATQEMTSARINVDGASNGFVSLAAMILPSNDAFIGTDDAVQLFSNSGRFLGEQTVTFSGEDVYDAGTEVNTELDAAFINQTGPNTGIDENGVVRPHDGFNGSVGNPEGEGDQIILGGTNAFGNEITDAADFTREGAEVAVVHINTVKDHQGTEGSDFIFGRRDDDIIDGGDGADFLRGGRGWDVIDGGDGNDIIRGSKGDDILNGSAGNDWISGGRDNDVIDGGSGDDWISGGRGNDMIKGGAGYDVLRGGRGDDQFYFGDGDGHDKILDFKLGEDKIILQLAEVNSFEDVLESAEQGRRGVELDFGDGDALYLRNVDIDDLSALDFMFA